MVFAVQDQTWKRSQKAEDIVFVGRYMEAKSVNKEVNPISLDNLLHDTTLQIRYEMQQFMHPTMSSNIRQPRLHLVNNHLQHCFPI
jgi:hypothetical protein